MRTSLATLRRLAPLGPPDVVLLAALSATAAASEVFAAGTLAAAVRGGDVPFLGQLDRSMLLAFAAAAVGVRSVASIADVVASNAVARTLEGRWRTRLLRAVAQTSEPPAPADLTHLTTVVSGQLHQVVASAAVAASAAVHCGLLLVAAALTRPGAVPIGVALIVVLAALPRALRAKSRALSARRAVAERALAVQVDETLGLAREIRLADTASRVQARLDVAMTRLQSLRRRAWWYGRVASDLALGLAPLAVVAAIAVGLAWGADLDAASLATALLALRAAQAGNAALAAWHLVEEALPVADAIRTATEAAEASVVRPPEVARASTPGLRLDALVPREGLPSWTAHLHGPRLAVLEGPAGCGKTSLLRVLTGSLTPASGTFALECPAGQAVVSIPARVGLLGATLAEEIDAHRGLPIEALRTAADRAGLATWPLDRPVTTATVSGGERQRIGFARALATRPAILLLDDPLRGLDPDRRSALLDTLSFLAREVLVVVASGDSDLRAQATASLSPDRAPGSPTA